MKLQFISYAILALTTAVVSASDVTNAHAVSLEEATQGIKIDTSVVNHEASMMSFIDYQQPLLILNHDYL
jgi:hypothetical protein